MIKPLTVEDLNSFIFIGYDDIKLATTIIKSGGNIYYDSQSATLKFIECEDKELFICYARKVIFIEEDD